MRENVIYESLEGKRGVRIEQASDGYQLLTMRNGFQWSGMPVDRDLLLRIHAAIDTVIDTDGVKVAAPRLTDRRIAELWYGGREPGHDVAPGYAVTFARAIEAELRGNAGMSGGGNG
jgi:hypothetical protein